MTTKSTAKGTQTTVTHADGTVSQRTSKTRAYTHAIEVSPAPAADYFNYLINQATSNNAQAAMLRRAAANPVVTIRDRGLGRTFPGADGEDYNTHQVTLKDTDGQIYTWSNSKGRVSKGGGDIQTARAYLTDSAIRRAEWHEAEAAKLVEQAREVLKAGQPVGEYFVARWSSSRALAVKAQTEFWSYSQRGHNVGVVEVDA